VGPRLGVGPRPYHTCDGIQYTYGENTKNVRKAKNPGAPSEKDRTASIFNNHFYCNYSITKCTLLQINSQVVEESFSKMAHLVIMI